MIKTITLCSSMQFKKEIVECATRLEAQGYVVLTPELSEKSTDYMRLSPEEQRRAKQTFIQNHFDRIAAADAILVLNYEKKGIGGYVGSNTLMEIGVAFNLKKKIYLLFPLAEQGCREEVTALCTGVLDGDISQLSR